MIITFISILKPIFLTNSFALFLYHIQWDPSHVNISETIAGNRSNQFGLLTEYKFCHKLSRSISIDCRYCNRFINLGRPIFSQNHSGSSAATVFTIPTTFGTAHAQCYTRAERPTQSTTRVGPSLLDALTVPSTQYVHKIVFTFRPMSLVCTNSMVNLRKHHEILYFSLHQQSAFPGPPFLVGCDSWWLRNDLSILRAPENIITIYLHMWSSADIVI